MRNAEITGWGMSVPPAILTNEDLETICDTNDEWIVTRTGIKERRISHVKTSEMAVVAARRAMACAGLGPEDIDLLIVATCTPDTLIPAAAAFVQAELGLTKAGAYDLNAACSGWVYALTQGNAMIKAGAAETVLIVGVERLSRCLDFADRTTCVLFGDGAGATVLQATDGDHGVLSGTLGIDGTTAEYLWIPDSGTNEHHLDKSDDGQAVRMDGPEVFKRAVRMMGDSSLKVVADAGLELEDVDLLIPHQANKRIIDATARRLKLDEDKVFIDIHKYGNTSAATIPIAMTEALAQGFIKPGSTIVFTAFGGGLTWAAAVVKWGQRTTPLGTSDAELAPSDLTALELLEPNLRGIL